MTELRLAGLSLDPSIVPLVRRLPALRTLDVTGTGLSQTALQALVSPKLTVVANAQSSGG